MHRRKLSLPPVQWDARSVPRADFCCALHRYPCSIAAPRRQNLLRLHCSGVFAAYHVLKRPPRPDTHAAVLGLFAAVLANAVATNGIKIMVRPPPGTDGCCLSVPDVSPPPLMLWISVCLGSGPCNCRQSRARTRRRVVMSGPADHAVNVHTRFQGALLAKMMSQSSGSHREPGMEERSFPHLF